MMPTKPYDKLHQSRTADISSTGETMESLSEVLTITSLDTGYPSPTLSMPQSKEDVSTTKFERFVNDTCSFTGIKSSTSATSLNLQDNLPLENNVPSFNNGPTKSPAAVDCSQCISDNSSPLLDRFPPTLPPAKKDLWSPSVMTAESSNNDDCLQILESTTPLVSSEDRHNSRVMFPDILTPADRQNIHHNSQKVDNKLELPSLYAPRFDYKAVDYSFYASKTCDDNVNTSPFYGQGGHVLLLNNRRDVTLPLGGTCFSESPATSNRISQIAESSVKYLSQPSRPSLPIPHSDAPASSVSPLPEHSRKERLPVLTSHLDSIIEQYGPEVISMLLNAFPDTMDFSGTPGKSAATEPKGPSSRTLYGKAGKGAVKHWRQLGITGLDDYVWPTGNLSYSSTSSKTTSDKITKLEYEPSAASPPTTSRTHSSMMCPPIVHPTLRRGDYKQSDSPCPLSCIETPETPVLLNATKRGTLLTTKCPLVRNSTRVDTLRTPPPPPPPSPTSSFMRHPAHDSALFYQDGSLRLDVFKVFPCTNSYCSGDTPIPGGVQQHDRKTCPFYHSQRDRRRPPSLDYKAEQCEHHFDLETDGPVACPLGDRCDKCHNRHELLYHPDIYKQRFCSSYNQLECHRGPFCAFAHTREEIRCELFSENDEKQPSAEFFMRFFKTLWCPYGIQHDWHGCLYAHTYQDCRRTPDIGYGSEPCPYWQKDLHSADYQRRCPSGPRCCFAHGSKEQLYHPAYYKTMPCADFRAKQTCPRGVLCAFYHDFAERRYAPPCAAANEIELSLRCMRGLQKNFLRPPLFNLDDFEAFGHAARVSTSTISSRWTSAVSGSQLPAFPSVRSSHARTPSMVPSSSFASRLEPSTASTMHPDPLELLWNQEKTKYYQRPNTKICSPEPSHLDDHSQPLLMSYLKHPPGHRPDEYGVNPFSKNIAGRDDIWAVTPPPKTTVAAATTPYRKHLYNSGNDDDTFWATRDPCYPIQQKTLYSNRTQKTAKIGRAHV